MLIFDTNMDIVNDTRNFLGVLFEMKDMSEADVTLGVKIKRIQDDISLSWSHNIEKILRKFYSFDVDLVRAPYDASMHLVKNKSVFVCQMEYAKIIGNVMFLMSYARPDIVYAVNRLTKYTHNSIDNTWIAFEHLLKYLKGAIDRSFHYGKFPTVLEEYSMPIGYLIMVKLILLVVMCSH